MIGGEVAADKIEVDNPRQNLESYFLDVVRKARENSAETSGATSGNKVAAYLRGEADAVPENQKMLDRLTVSEAPKPAPVTKVAASEEKIDQAKLQSLGKTTEAAPAVAPVPQPAPPADLNKANEKLSSLLGKPKS